MGSAVTVWFIFLPLLLIVGGVGWSGRPLFLETPPEARTRDCSHRRRNPTADAIVLTLLSIPLNAPGREPRLKAHGAVRL